MYVVRVPRIVFPPAVTDSVSTMVTSAADATTEERAIARRSAARIWPPRQLMRIAIIRAARRSFRRAWPRDTQIPNPESLPRPRALDDFLPRHDVVECIPNARVLQRQSSVCL